MAPHLTGAKRKHDENAIDAICGECYRYHKYRFKRDEFVKKDGYKHPDVLRAKPPGKMPIDEWNRHIDFFLQPDQIKKSETNSKNRSKQPYPSVQGTRTNAASRYSRKELQDALKSSQESGENVPEKEVVKKVLGIRSGHTRGVGRKLKGVSSSSSATSSSSSYYGGSKAYTQDEVNNLIETEAEKGIPLDKTPVVGEEDEEYEESDDEEMEVLDEDEETNDGDDSVE
ncbi:hypothetical protein Tco_0406954 [Tanacetum coccineum]